MRSRTIHAATGCRSGACTSDMIASEIPPAERLRTMRRSFDSTVLRRGAKRSAMSIEPPTITMTAAVITKDGAERNCPAIATQLLHMCDSPEQIGFCYADGTREGARGSGPSTRHAV